MTETPQTLRVREILASVEQLAVEYYRLTGRPLGVTGEVAEYVAVAQLKLDLAPPRQAGYDALRGKERIQIKGRALTKGKGKPGQRLGRIKPGADCDTVMLVILDNTTLELSEILEAEYTKVCERLARPSRAHDRGALSISEFRGIAKAVWPPPSN